MQFHQLKSALDSCLRRRREKGRRSNTNISQLTRTASDVVKEEIGQI